MKTIFISSFHGYISRNILSTDAFRMLADRSDLRLVIFVSRGKREFFEENFAKSNVFIEEVFFGPSSNVSLGALIAKRVAKYGLDSASTRIERQMKLKNEKRIFYWFLISLNAFLLSRSATLQRLMRFFDYHLGPKRRYGAYFHKYKPDLAVATDIQNERDVELLHNAKTYGVRTAGMVRSWDNLTLHGMLRIIPDMLLVTSRRVKELAISLNSVPIKRIKIVGIPHYDKYYRGPQISKHNFFSKLGLDPIKHTILWAPISDYYISDNDVDPFIFHFLGKIASKLDMQIIARFSPSLEVKSLENVKPYSNMVIDRPGVRFEDGGKELSCEDDDRLMNEIYFSDVVVCGPSTLALDAVFMGKPVVLVGFHPKPRPYLKSIMRRFDYDHFVFAIQCGAVRMARNEEELEKFIDEYIENPSKDMEGREKLIDAYGGFRDGKSGKRFMLTILSFFT